ncbi:hypothetical protein [Acidovorax sp. BL-A-41-H1]|uniref:hypothetical protein n=1 Tax=Acidovorax sp. BL-A-41-H1 TaxID=3421102 RepID=UPI003F7AE692
MKQSHRADVAPCAAPSAVRSWRIALALLALAGALGGCTSTPSSARSSDPASPQQRQGASGISVFGDIDVGVTRERSR